MTTYHTTTVDGARMFYRQAGKPGAPAVLLLHGVSDLIPHVSRPDPGLGRPLLGVAPDLPGIGFSDTPDRKTFACTFEHLAAVIDRFTEVIGLKRFAIYVLDYGAPVGFRLALKHPERITAIISQNGNAYEEGLGDGWNPIQAYWREPTEAHRTALRDFLTPEATRWQYAGANCQAAPLAAYRWWCKHSSKLSRRSAQKIAHRHEQGS